MASWLSNWAKRRKITVNSAVVDSPLTHFPVTVFLSSAAGSSGTDVTSIFDEVGTASQRIAFTDATGTNQLYAEIDVWDSGSEDAVIHVSGSEWSVGSGTDTEFYMYYDSGKSPNTSYIGLVAGTSPSTEVWDKYHQIVLHMNDDETNTTLDSTSNGFDGTKTEANGPNEVDGVVGNAQDHDGVNDHIDIADTDLGADTYTISFWFSGSDPTTHEWQSYIIDCQLGGVGYIYWKAHSDEQLFTGAGGTLYVNGVTSTDVSPNIWHHIVLTGASWTIETLRIGDYQGGGFQIRGKMDEVRVSNVARNAGWIKADYMSGSDKLVDFSAEETPPAETKTKTYTADALIEEQNKTKTYALDALIEEQAKTKTYTLDACLGTCGTKMYTLDALLEEQNKTKTYTLDVHLALADQTKTYTLDANLASRNTKTYTLDVLLEEQAKTKTYNLDAIVFKYITNVQELQDISNNLSGYYILANDINASVSGTWNGGAGFEPIGTTASPFTGTLDGNGYVVNGLYINRPSADNDSFGLFGVIDSPASVLNLGLTNVDMTFGGQLGNVGVLVGHVKAGSTITECFVSGGNLTTDSTYSTTGGFVGFVEGEISDCYAALDSVTNLDLTGSKQVGGFVASTRDGTIITRCYSAVVTISADDVPSGFVDDTRGSITNSFWDEEICNLSTSLAGTAKTTAEMQTESTFTDASWDFTDIWVMSHMYPILRVFNRMTYSLDALLKVLGVTKTYVLDALIEEGSVTQTYSLDAIIRAKPQVEPSKISYKSPLAITAFEIPKRPGTSRDDLIQILGNPAMEITLEDTTYPSHYIVDFRDIDTLKSKFRNGTPILLLVGGTWGRYKIVGLTYDETSDIGVTFSIRCRKY